MGEFDVKALLEGATVGHAAASVGLKDLQSVLPCTSASLLTRIISVMSQGDFRELGSSGGLARAPKRCAQGTENLYCPCLHGPGPRALL